MTELDLDKIPFADWPFSAKAKHWRENGAPGVTFQGGQYMFHDTTVKQYAQNEIDSAAREGRTIVPADEHGNPR